MLMEVQFREATEQFSFVIDRVQGLSPVVIKARENTESDTVLLKYGMVHRLLDCFKFDIELMQEDDGSVSLWLNPFGLYVNASSEEEAFNSLAKDAVVYAKEFMKNPRLYLNSPNRRNHFPHILKVMLCDNYEQVKDMLLRNAEIQRS